MDKFDFRGEWLNRRTICFRFDKSESWKGEKMSKKRKIKLKRCRYYASYPNGGHPSLIYRKNKKKNKYDAVVFGTTPGHHKKELDYPISPSVKQSVIQTRPIRGTRSDLVIENCKA